MTSPRFMASKASCACEMSRRLEIIPSRSSRPALHRRMSRRNSRAHVSRPVVAAKELLLHEEQFERVELDLGLVRYPLRR